MSITGMSITILSRFGMLICGTSGVIPTDGILISGTSTGSTVGISKSGISKSGITGKLTAVVPAGAGAGGSGTGAGSDVPDAAPPPYGCILRMESLP